MPPEITVLLPVFNGELYVAECIESVLAQSFYDIELLVIEDGSTDNTKEIVLSYVDSRIVYKENVKNIGLTCSLNAGLKNSKGRYVSRIDADDVMYNNRLEKQFHFLEKNPDVTVVGSHCIVFNQKSGESKEWIWPVDRELTFLHLLMGRNPVGHPLVMYRSGDIQKVGGYNENYRFAQDVDLWFRLVREGFLFFNIPEFLTMYRVHGGQVSSSVQCQQVDTVYDSFYSFYRSIVGKRYGSNKIKEYVNFCRDIDSSFKFKQSNFDIFNLLLDSFLDRKNNIGLKMSKKEYIEKWNEFIDKKYSTYNV